jgi:hypothetical protein
MLLFKNYGGYGQDGTKTKSRRNNGDNVTINPVSKS